MPHGFSRRRVPMPPSGSFKNSKCMLKAAKLCSLQPHCTQRVSDVTQTMVSNGSFAEFALQKPSDYTIEVSPACWLRDSNSDITSAILK